MFINDSGFKNIDFNYVTEGNPGVGGTQFEFALLSYYLSHNKDFIVTVFHINNNVYPINCNDVIVSDFEGAIKKASEAKTDFFMCHSGLPNLVDYLNRYKINAILWAHNFLRPNKIFPLNKCQYVKRIVCVGSPQYFITKFFSKKADLIYNMVSPVIYSSDSDKNHVITYMGSLIPAKGFHILAKQWKYIVSKVPDAELYVIGSGSLYNRDSKLGKYNIAQEKYEKLILNHLGVGEGDTIPENIHFLGNIGLEKREIISKTLVGIVNPSKQFETFGISALDFNVGKCIAIGNMPAIKNGKNGFNIIGGYWLRKKIVKCLKDKCATIELGIKSSEWVKNNFFPDVIMPKWEKLFKELTN
jgi:glycosyltransferase involved in cell wall biosynthesis